MPTGQNYALHDSQHGTQGSLRTFPKKYEAQQFQGDSPTFQKPAHVHEQPDSNFQP